jgi:hypothetical protein
MFGLFDKQRSRPKMATAQGFALHIQQEAG